MPQSFDPYERWLGIPLAEQPPNLYRLLGVERFESDLSVIEQAASRRMILVRRYQVGAHSEDSLRLLAELASAQVRLLDPQEKENYDEALRAEFGDERNIGGKVTRTQARPLRRAKPIVDASATDPNLPVASVVERDTDGGRDRGTFSSDTASIHGVPPATKPISRFLAAGVGLVATALFALVVYAAVSMNGDNLPSEPPASAAVVVEDAPDPEAAWKDAVATTDATAIDTNAAETADEPNDASSSVTDPPEPTLVLQWAETDRRNARLEIDGLPVQIANDAAAISVSNVQFILSPGDHQIRIEWSDAASFADTVRLAGNESHVLVVQRPPLSAPATDLVESSPPLPPSATSPELGDVSTAPSEPEKPKNPPAAPVVIPVGMFQGMRGRVACLSRSADGQGIFAASDTGEVFYWDVATGGTRALLQITGRPQSVSETGRVAVVEELPFNAGIQHVSIWDSVRRLRFRDVTAPQDASALVDRSGTFLYLAGADRILIYAIDPGILAKPIGVARGDALESCWLASNPFAKDTIVSVYRKRNGSAMIRLNEALTANHLADVSFRSIEELRNCVASLSLSGERLIIANEQGVRMIDVSSGKQLLALPDDGEILQCLTFLPGDDRIVAGADSGKLMVWDASTGELLTSRSAHSGGVSAVALIDQTHFVTGGQDGSIKLWQRQDSR